MKDNTMIKLSDKHVKGYKVKITDCSGSFEIAENVQSASRILHVTVQRIYQALCDGTEVRGCRLDKVI